MEIIEEGNKPMTCTKCGSDVTGKKFCPDCGTPVQAATLPGDQTCPNCHNEVKPNAAFCIHCGTSLHAGAPAPTHCPACHQEVAANTDFCTNCGHDMRVGASTTATVQASASSIACPACGHQNAASMRFCGQCGGPLGTPVPQNPYGQAVSNPVNNPYSQPQNPYQQGQYPQQAYGQPQNPYQQGQYPQQSSYYNQGGYQAQPMMGQGPMTLRCPVCMAMAPVGTPNCVSCHTSLAGVVPTPANMPAQGQQGFLQGNGGGMAMGALGGIAAVIGGEMLLHGIENSIENRDDDGWGHRRRDDGLLGGLGNVIDDIGL
jgi:hypothetical protein